MITSQRQLGVVIIMLPFVVGVSRSAASVASSGSCWLRAVSVWRRTRPSCSCWDSFCRAPKWISASAKWRSASSVSFADRFASLAAFLYDDNKNTSKKTSASSLQLQLTSARHTRMLFGSWILIRSQSRSSNRLIKIHQKKTRPNDVHGDILISKSLFFFFSC